MCRFDGSSKTFQEPNQPVRDVQIAFLRSFERGVVLGPLLADLRTHAVEPLRYAVGTRQRHVGYGPCDPPIAIVEGMDRDEPKMSECGLEHIVRAVRRVEPFQEGLHFGFEPVCRRSLEVHALLSHKA